MVDFIFLFFANRFGPKHEKLSVAPLTRYKAIFCFAHSSRNTTLDNILFQDREKV